MHIVRTPHRYVRPGEFDLVARPAGLELGWRWTDRDRRAFTAVSRHHVFVCRLKRPAGLIEQLECEDNPPPRTMVMGDDGQIPTESEKCMPAVGGDDLHPLDLAALSEALGARYTEVT